jgi:hypothetical protein
MAFCLPAGSTSVIMTYEPGVVIIATDSKENSATGKSSRFWCKIHVTPNYVWTSAGISLDMYKGFDLAKLVPYAMRDGIPFFASVDRLEPRIKSAFRSVNNDYLAAGGDRRGTVITVILASVRTVGQNSELSMSGSHGLQRSDCPAKDCDAIGTLTAGHDTEMRRILTARPDLWREMGGVQPALNYLIGEEEKADPQAVGGDIQMIAIDSHGARWIQKGPCH